jgi:hypothetical protein
MNTTIRKIDPSRALVVVSFEDLHWRSSDVLWCKQVLRLIESRWEGAQPAIGRDRVGKSIGTTLRVSVGTYLPSIPSAVYPIRS